MPSNGNNSCLTQSPKLVLIASCNVSCMIVSTVCINLPMRFLGVETFCHCFSGENIYGLTMEMLTCCLYSNTHIYRFYLRLNMFLVAIKNLTNFSLHYFDKNRVAVVPTVRLTMNKFFIGTKLEISIILNWVKTYSTVLFNSHI